MKYYNVSFRSGRSIVSGDIYSGNIACADSIASVVDYYAAMGYDRISVTEAQPYEVEDAKRKGKPFESVPSPSYFEDEHWDYMVLPCTAIADCDKGGEENRQEALLVLSRPTHGGEVVKHVVFGCPMPTSQEDFENIEWESVNDTVRVGKLTMKGVFDAYYGWLTCED